MGRRDAASLSVCRIKFFCTCGALALAVPWSVIDGRRLRPGSTLRPLADDTRNVTAYNYNPRSVLLPPLTMNTFTTTHTLPKTLLATDGSQGPEMRFSL